MRQIMAPAAMRTQYENQMASHAFAGYSTSRRLSIRERVAR